MADYVLIYDTLTGRLVTKLAETVHIEDGAITSAKLASGQVGSLHVKPATIVSALIASGQLGTDHFAPGQIVSAYIGAGEIGGGLVKDGGILSGKYGAGSIRTADIGDAQIVSALIASGQVGSLHVKPVAIISSLIASGALGRDHILNGEIVSALIASGQLGSLHIAPNAIISGLVASGGLAPLTLGKLWVGGTGNKPTEIYAATVVRKTADQTVNNSTTLVNDDHLLLAVGANEVWAVELYLLHNTSTGADLDYAFTVPSGGALYGISWGKDDGGTWAGGGFLATNETPVMGLGANYQTSSCRVIVVNGATAGNLQFQWAQHAAEVSDTKVLTNSILVCRRIA